MCYFCSAKQVKKEEMNREKRPPHRFPVAVFGFGDDNGIHRLFCHSS